MYCGRVQCLLCFGKIVISKITICSPFNNLPTLYRQYLYLGVLGAFPVWAKVLSHNFRTAVTKNCGKITDAVPSRISGLSVSIILFLQHEVTKGALTLLQTHSHWRQSDCCRFDCAMLGKLLHSWTLNLSFKSSKRKSIVNLTSYLFAQEKTVLYKILQYLEWYSTQYASNSYIMVLLCRQKAVGKILKPHPMK